MTADDFLTDPAVSAATGRLRERWGGRVVSDLVDAEGHQYVDLVMEGGGTLGVALLGYLHALETVGIRFLSVAGASAGAVSAMLLAARADKAAPRAPALLDAVGGQDFAEFMDGGPAVRRFVGSFAPQLSLLGMVAGAVPAARRLWGRLGLHPGDAFERWYATLLARDGIATLAELEARVAEPPRGLRVRDGAASGHAAGPTTTSPRLVLIATELTTGTKLVFPLHVPLIWSDDPPPSRLVRASMSIPFFFEPLAVPFVAGDREHYRRAWRELTGYRGTLAETGTVLVDGGVISNFPISAFHATDRVPRCPTFGVKLGGSDETAEPVDRVATLGWRAFVAAQRALDEDFLLRHPDYRQLVTHVDTGPHHWLDFRLSEAAKADLFLRGVEAGAAFLLGADGAAPRPGFDWESYLVYRRRQREARLEMPTPLVSREQEAASDELRGR